MNKERYCLETDDDGHCYLIKASEKELFCLMLGHGDEDDFCEFIERFDNCRVNPSMVTFADPKVE